MWLKMNMPETGIEPERVLPRRILSPVRLPIPPLGQGTSFSTAHLIYQRTRYLSIDFLLFLHFYFLQLVLLKAPTYTMLITQGVPAFFLQINYYTASPKKINFLLKQRVLFCALSHLFFNNPLHLSFIISALDIRNIIFPIYMVFLFIESIKKYIFLSLILGTTMNSPPPSSPHRESLGIFPPYAQWLKIDGIMVILEFDKG